MLASQIIGSKRDGKELSQAEIAFFIRGLSEGSIPDYQCAAFLMAAYLKGLSFRETLFLTEAMVASGHPKNLGDMGGKKIDKHSTGGVGDKTTLIVAPLAAAGGVCVPKLSGRGLGHTGGTIDKLESIPGFRADLSYEEMTSQLKKIGLAVAATSKEIAPADKKLYALRDVTATVDSVPLIAASIMSKKLSIDSDGILLDVKVGKGAFMKEIAGAEELANLMVSIGRDSGRNTTALITAMDEPLGMAVGNSLEVAEAIRVLKGKGPDQLTELCLRLAGWMFRLAGVSGDESEGYRYASSLLEEGRGLEKFKEFIAAQGGDERVVDEPGVLKSASFRSEVKGDYRGFVGSIDALVIGEAAMLLGAGRRRKEDDIDYSAGIELSVSKGDYVEKGQALAVLHRSGAEGFEQVETLVKEAFTWTAERPEIASPLIKTVS